MPFKKCRSCNKRRKLDEFVRESRNSSGYSSRCKYCKRNYDTAYYSKTPQRRLAISRRKKKLGATAGKYISSYLRTHPCVDCGEDDIAVLDFDHVRGTKRDNISKLRYTSLKAVQEEIKKCEVRCANCHRRKTARQARWKYKVPRKHK